ncbi:hypothetical protein PG997_007224 [Apiospora hydei]|uniref:Major facilitator superfamily (MFS) profile domain-containing protein n=1 Tax=Apiospora hydei TaxID=1337664 RepID=A0ABR1W7E1_9PEZI
MDNNSAAANDGPPRHRNQWRSHRGQVPDSLALLDDSELREDALRFAQNQLGMKGNPEQDELAGDLVRASFVARDASIYDRVAHGDPEYVDRALQVTLTEDEMQALANEKDKLFSEKDQHRVTAVVCFAAFLQGHVQASFNSSSLYPDRLGADSSFFHDGTADRTWALGIINAVPWFAAACIGCWLAPPVNSYFGRKGAIAISATLILLSSLASGLTCLIPDVTVRWKILLGVRIVNGLGMGMKAVSTPILSSETSIRFWRGSFLLAWQLWVACGIMVGLLLNLIFVVRIPQESGDVALGLILGAPAIPAVLLLVVLWSCPESPRYYMRIDSRNYNPKKAYEELKKIRGKCELLALKDIYLLYKTIEEEHNMQQLPERQQGPDEKPVRRRRTGGFLDLFTQKRLRNALISASTVALSQQLCGMLTFGSVNVTAFYSGPLFNSLIEGDARHKNITALGLSVGIGAVMFFCGLPAIKTIDTLGRRKWLISTLPLMCIFMAAAAYAYPVPYGIPHGGPVQAHTARVIITLLYLHTAVYAPGLGPIPFTLASESFPLSHREIHQRRARPQAPGSLGLFSGLTLLAWVLVYFLVEETRELSLENLHDVFSVPKTQFVQLKYRRLLWLARRYLLPRHARPGPVVVAADGVPFGLVRLQRGREHPLRYFHARARIERRWRRHHGVVVACRSGRFRGISPQGWPERQCGQCGSSGWGVDYADRFNTRATERCCFDAPLGVANERNI